MQAGGMRWHVQIAGTGPVLLLLHGTGASTHSWRDLLPLLARDFTLITPDLPGHGFSGAPTARESFSLPGMARLTSQLLAQLQMTPTLVVGHSAGAAIAARMALQGDLDSAQLVSLNGALLPLPGMPVPLFLLAGRMMAATSVLSRLFARRATDPAMVRRLIGGTGSQLDARGHALYQRLVSDPVHVRNTLSMMANWDLRPLQLDLPRLQRPLLLVATGSDRTVPPSESARVHRLVTHSRLLEIAALGHLAHEEAPARFAELLLQLSPGWEAGSAAVGASP
jgi:magnesium chelatase accessory protein